MFTWGSICLAHIRFRAAWKHHGHTLDELPFKAIFGVWGSYVGLGLVILVLIAQFYTAIKPLTAYDFFQNYLAFPVVLTFYAGCYLYTRRGWLSLDNIDVDSGRRAIDWEAHEALKAKKQGWPVWRRVLDKVL